MKVRMWIVIVAVAALCQVASANLLLNPDFALSGTPGQLDTASIPNWTSWNGNLGGWYANDIGGQMSVKFWEIPPGIFQNWDCTAGDVFTLSVQGYQTPGEQLTTEAGYLKVEWLDASFVAFDSQVLRTMTGSDPVGSWNTLSGVATAAVGAVHGRITLGLQGTTGTGAIYFDNADVSPIPEPGTLALLGLGLVGLWRVGRKAKG